MIGRDTAAAIADGKAEHAVCHRAVQAHRTGLGELDRVAEQIDENLAHPLRITLEHRQRRGVMRFERDPFFARHHRHRGEGFFGQRLRGKCLDAHWHAPGLNARQVEDVVDEAEQMFGRCADAGQRFFQLLGVRVICIFEQHA